MFLRKFPIKMPTIARKLYFKLLMSFIILAVIIVLSTSLIFSTMYINSIYSQLSIEYTYSLERLNSDFDNIFNQIKQINLYLRQSTEINSFLTDTNADSLTINRSDIFLKQMGYTNPYLHSIILLNKDHDYPITTGKTDIDFKQFINAPLSFLDIDSSLKIVSCSSTPNGFEGISTLDTISVIFSDSQFKEKITGDAIIMNFDKEEIEKKLLGKYEGITLVTDNAGNVIYTSYNYTTKKNIKTEPFFTGILSSGEIKGYFNIDPDNDTKLVTYVKSLESGLYLINIRSLKDITGTISHKRNTVILIGTLILIFFGLIGYFISRNIYSPIKKVTEMMSSSKFASSPHKIGEIATIAKVFTETQEQLKELEIISQDRNSRLKMELLGFLLQSNSITKNMENELLSYDLKIEFANLIIISIKLDNYSQIDATNKFAYVTTLCKTIPELLIKEFDCEAVNMFEGEIAILLNYRNKLENNFNTLLSAMENIREISKSTLHISLTVGIGGAANSISECMATYKKAVEMVKYRFIMGMDRTYYQRYLDENLTTNNIYPVEIEEKLIESIKLNKKDVFSETLQNAIELIRCYHYSEAVSVFFQIITACIKTVNQTTSQVNNGYYLSFDDISDIFSSLQTLEQAKDWLIGIFDEYQAMLEQISRLKNNKHYKIIEKVQDYMKQNYRDINISVETLADIAGYTPYYLSKIFKEITGMNVIDYMRQIRINKAKELLGQDKHKINEVPGMVGFTNISHFYSVFKKDVGLTPASYREYILNSSKTGSLPEGNN